MLCWLSSRRIVVIVAAVARFSNVPSLVYCGCGALCCCSIVNVLVSGGDFFSFWTLILRPPWWHTAALCGASFVHVFLVNLSISGFECVPLCVLAALLSALMNNRFSAVATVGVAAFLIAGGVMLLDFLLIAASMYPNRCSSSAFLLHMLVCKVTSL